MIRNKSILTIIAARKGSKRLKGKNLLNLGDKPLVAWTIEEAVKSKYIDQIIISTDDEKIFQLPKKYEKVTTPFIRPDRLSSDEATSFDVLLHSINFYKLKGDVFDYVMLLQPTSPLRI
jgi:CMP-N-acetylneuraminic acid synthetase